MHPPDISIDVDRDTGHWTTDGLPMLYMPRHFFMGITETVEAAIGREAAESHFYKAGFDAAFRWCQAESGRSGLKGMDVFHHYMRRLSQRGWRMFDGSAIDPKTGVGTVALRHSSFVAHFGRGSGRQVCYVCGGWAPGALAWVSQSLGMDWHIAGHEERCAAQGHEHCELLVFDSREERGGPSSAEPAMHQKRQRHGTGIRFDERAHREKGRHKWSSIGSSSSAISNCRKEGCCRTRSSATPCWER